MSSKVRLLIVIVLVIAGIAVMVYPSLSNYINAIHSSHAVQEFSEQLEDADSDTLREQRLLAEEYNSALAGRIADPEEDADILKKYDRIMDFGNGIMGYIRIPEINVELSVYHGVSHTVLQKGVGHVPTSAFPIGGAGNHCVLTGHTGLPSAELFSDLTELAVGDLFYLHVLDETLVYEIDQITVVLPHEVDTLGSVPGRDYCTLVTCTPYGINSHRLLVRGERIGMDTPAAARQEAAAADTGVQIPMELILAGSAVILLLAAGLLILIRREPGAISAQDPRIDKE